MLSQVLYKRAKTGAVLEWQIESENGRYRTISGQQGGQKITSQWTQAVPTNVGQSNHRDELSQANFEVAAKVKAKFDEGYSLDVTSIDSRTFYTPMLAHEYEKVTAKHPLKFPVYSQPKLDGVRCIVTKDGMFSRNGKPFVAAPHIREILEPFFIRFPGAELDGELYNHNLKDNFNKIISHVRKINVNEKELAESKEAIQYWVYDTRHSDSLDFNARFDFLKQNVAGRYEPVVRLLWTAQVPTQDVLDILKSEYITAGFEGQMIRKGDSLYENCRTNSLLKRKDMQTEEFEIKDVMEGKGNRSGIAGAVVFERSGKRFQSSIVGSHDYCRDLLANKTRYIGQLATVKFQNLTPDGIPRFPEMLVLRNYE